MNVSTQRLVLPASLVLGEGRLPIGLLATFLALYSIYPNNTPHYDELYHVLAGVSFATNGTLALGDGVYERTPLYTMLVGQMFRAFGVSLAAARLPSIVATAVWVVVVYLIARPAAGRLGATVAAVGFGLCPLVADIAKMTRFYAIHGLLFTIGAFAFYRATVTGADLTGRALGYALAVISLLAAGYLQVTTAIGVAGLIAWLAGWCLLRWLGSGRTLVIGVAIGAIGGLLLLLTASELGLLTRALEAYRHTAPWAADRANYEGFYVDLLLKYYPALLPLLPLAAIGAVALQPRPALFCLTVFGVGIVLHTFGGMKTERYVTYLMPFFWIVLGISATPAIRGAANVIASAAATILAMPLLRAAPKEVALRAVQAAALASALSFAWINLAGPQTLNKLIHRLDPPVPDWQGLAAELALDPQTVVLTANDLHALYFIGDFHARLGPAGGRGRIDAKTGRPIVSDATELASIIACHPRGVLIADAWRWGNPGVVSVEVRTYAERHLDDHPAAAGRNLVIHTWSHERPPSGDCAVGPFARPLRLQPLAAS